MGLQQTYGKEWLKSTKRLTVHVLESRLNYEFSHSRCYEEILHLLPNLKELKIAFTGWCNAEGWKALDASGKPLHYQSFETCPSCANKGCSRSVSFRRGSYVDGMVQADGTTPVEVPDIIVGFNLDFMEIDFAPGFRSTLPYIIDRRWPLLLTSFAEDVAIVGRTECNMAASKGTGNKDKKAKVLAGPAPNPYAGQNLRQDVMGQSGELEAAKAGLTAEQISKRWAAGLPGAPVSKDLPAPTLAMDQFYADNRWYALYQGREA